MPPTPEPPSAQLARGLRAGNLTLVRAAARELAPLPLPVAFEVLLLIGRKEPTRWTAAAVRFVGRVAVEHAGVSLDDVIDLARALRDGGHAELDVLRELAQDLGLDLRQGLHLWPPASVAAGE